MTQQGEFDARPWFSVFLRKSRVFASYLLQYFQKRMSMVSMCFVIIVVALIAGPFNTAMKINNFDTVVTNTPYPCSVQLPKTGKKAVDAIMEEYVTAAVDIYRSAAEGVIEETYGMEITFFGERKTDGSCVFTFTRESRLGRYGTIFVFDARGVMTGRRDYPQNGSAMDASILEIMKNPPAPYVELQEEDLRFCIFMCGESETEKTRELRVWMQDGIANWAVDD